MSCTHVGSPEIQVYTGQIPKHTWGACESMVKVNLRRAVTKGIRSHTQEFCWNLQQVTRGSLQGQIGGGVYRLGGFHQVGSYSGILFLNLKSVGYDHDTFNEKYYFLI